MTLEQREQALTGPTQAEAARIFQQQLEAVHPKHRQKGITKRMGLKFALHALAAGKPFLYSDVQHGNAPSERMQKQYHVPKLFTAAGYDTYLPATLDYIQRVSR